MSIADKKIADLAALPSVHELSANVAWAMPTSAHAFSQLCHAFNSLCRANYDRKDLDPNALRSLDDRLWEMTRQICRDIVNLNPSDILNLKRTALEPHVLAWYKSNPDLTPIWEKRPGYSGGYEIIELICQDRRAWSSFQDVLSNHLLRSTMASQHRQKVAAQAEFMRSVLAQQASYIRLLNMGCGPCCDLRSIIHALPPYINATVTLVDLDGQALSYARKHLKDHPGVRYEWIQNDVLSAIRNMSEREATFDGIVFGGLFDYLSDAAIRRVLSRSVRLLRRDGGRLMFSQVSTANPDRAFMEWFGDWTLIERDEYRLACLCSDAGIPSGAVRMWREATGIAILAVVGAHI